MDHPRRVVLLLTSPRVGAGLLSREAWTVLGRADAVLARSMDEPLARALGGAGITVHPVGDPGPAVLAARLVARAGAGEVVWAGSVDADPGLGEALATALTAHEDPPELEMLIGSWDVPGARLLDAVAVMDRLRSPGGCPWDAEQTHASLTPYLLEEAHEAVEALETGDRGHMVEELGDVLLQVLFHARVADEHGEDPFDVDDVAAALVTKLVHRHPHVFDPSPGDAVDAGAVEAGWEQLKAAEKPGRSGPLEGIPAGMPELARATKVASRLERTGRGPWLAAQVEEALAAPGGTAYGARLMALVLQARRDGVDPGAALRATLREVTDALGPDPAAGERTAD